MFSDPLGPADLFVPEPVLPKQTIIVSIYVLEPNWTLKFQDVPGENLVSDDWCFRKPEVQPSEPPPAVPVSPLFHRSETTSGIRK